MTQAKRDTLGKGVGGPRFPFSIYDFFEWCNDTYAIPKPSVSGDAFQRLQSLQALWSSSENISVELEPADQQWEILPSLKLDGGQPFAEASGQGREGKISLRPAICFGSERDHVVSGSVDYSDGSVKTHRVSFPVGKSGLTLAQLIDHLGQVIVGSPTTPPASKSIPMIIQPANEQLVASLAPDSEIEIDFGEKPSAECSFDSSFQTCLSKPNGTVTAHFKGIEFAYDSESRKYLEIKFQYSIWGKTRDLYFHYPQDALKHNMLCKEVQRPRPPYPPHPIDLPEDLKELLRDLGTLAEYATLAAMLAFMLAIIVQYFNQKIAETEVEIAATTLVATASGAALALARRATARGAEFDDEAAGENENTLSPEVLASVLVGVDAIANVIFSHGPEFLLSVLITSNCPGARDPLLVTQGLKSAGGEKFAAGDVAKAVHENLGTDAATLAPVLVQVYRYTDEDVETLASVLKDNVTEEAYEIGIAVRNGLPTADATNLAKALKAIDPQLDCDGLAELLTKIFTKEMPPKLDYEAIARVLANLGVSSTEAAAALFKHVGKDLDDIAKALVEADSWTTRDIAQALAATSSWTIKDIAIALVAAKRWTTDDTETLADTLLAIEADHLTTAVAIRSALPGASFRQLGSALVMAFRIQDANDVAKLLGQLFNSENPPELDIVALSPALLEWFSDVSCIQMGLLLIHAVGKRNLTDSSVAQALSACRTKTGEGVYTAEEIDRVAKFYNCFFVFEAYATPFPAPFYVHDVDGSVVVDKDIIYFLKNAVQGYSLEHLFWKLPMSFDKSFDTKWVKLEDPPIPLAGAAIALLDYKIFVFGGETYTYDEERVWQSNQTFCYDIAKNSWSKRKKMIKPMPGGCAAVGDKIYIIGGSETRGTGCYPCKSVQIYDPFKDTWTYGPDLPKARNGHDCVAIGTAIYVIGGSSEEDVCDTNFVLDTETGHWSPIALASVQKDRDFYTPGVAAWREYIFAAGGELSIKRGSPRAAHEILAYDTKSDSWAQVGYSPLQRLNFRGAAIVTQESGSSLLCLIGAYEKMDKSVQVFGL